MAPRNYWKLDDSRGTNPSTDWTGSFRPHS